MVNYLVREWIPISRDRIHIDLDWFFLDSSHLSPLSRVSPLIGALVDE